MADRYNTPAEGTQDWHEPLNENFQALDTDVEQRDEGHPDDAGYEAVAGAKYLDISNGEIYIVSDGSWESLGVIGEGGGNGIESLSGGDGIDPADIVDGEELSVAWADAEDLDDAGNVLTDEAPEAGRYLVDENGERNFTGPAEWENAGATETNDVFGDGSVVGGGAENAAGDDEDDTVTHSTVGGGEANNAGGDHATVAGGSGNDATGDFSTITGGRDNNSAATYTSIGGGINNLTGLSFAVVAGGEGNQVLGSHSVISGGQSNDVFTTITHAAIGGGFENHVAGHYGAVGGGERNEVHTDHASVGGGESNIAGDDEEDTETHAAVGGGFDNEASARSSVVAGGEANNAAGDGATVGGGHENTSRGLRSVVAGGEENLVEDGAEFGTIPGGQLNTASGIGSFAAGIGASAAHDGTFVWGDETDNEPESAATQQFVIDANGGLYLGDDGGPTEDFVGERDEFIATSTGAHLTTGGAWTDNSSRTTKTDIDPVDTEVMLERVTDLSVSEWRYTEGADDARHVGPMAEDFHDIFGLGRDDEHIAPLDSAGVALAAIKGLTARVAEKQETINEQAKRIEDLEARLDRLEAGAA